MNPNCNGLDLDGLIERKLEFWERKLLDLSLRNALLNLRAGRSCLPLAAGGEALQALLSGERELALLPWTPEALPGEDSFDTLARLGCEGLPSEAELPVLAGEAALEASVKRLYRGARTAMDECGVGTLFAGVGMLRWTDRRGERRLAPLALLPVQLVHRRLRWVLAPREGEASINITLLEKLRREYDLAVAGVDPLPTDAGGRADLPAVYAAFRQAVADRKDWTVLDLSALANFPYGAFAMWNDLRRRRKALAENPVTRSLITGIRMPASRSIPVEAGPLLPLDTDATQLEAVQAARRGESFVLVGPPGTGKSQTITTMIANLLADGHRVLFVAEKQAALEVVGRRLDAIGLRDCCVTLHSDAVSARGALDQLQRMIDQPEPPAADGYGEIQAQSDRREAELDAVFNALRAPMPCGMDLYGLIQRCEALADAPEMAPPEPAYLEALTPSRLADARRMTARLCTAGRALGHPSRFPLSALPPERFEAEALSTLEAGLRACRTALVELGQANAALGEGLGKQSPVTRAEHLRLSVAATEAIFWSAEERRPLRTLARPQWLELKEMANAFVEAAKLRAMLEKRFEPAFFEQDGEALYREWRAAEAGGLLKGVRAGSLLRRVNAWAREPLAADALWVPLRALANLQAREAAGRAALEKYRSLLGEGFRAEATDWEALQARLDEDSEHARRFGGQEWLAVPRERLLSDPGALSLARRAVKARAGLTAAWSALDGVSAPEADEGNWLQAQLDWCDRALAALDGAADWQAWLHCAEEARAMGLDCVVRAYVAGMDPDALWPALEKAICGALAEARIQADPALKRFTGTMADALAAEYRRLDTEKQTWSRRVLARRLYERRRALLEAAAQTPDLARLRRACAAKRGETGLRRLFQQIPDLMAGLCGCMLMNPMSVARLLPDEMPDFDVVVFDEASQLLTCRAVGALSRARSAIVVGDPNQMPPTTFFTAQGVLSEEADLEDLDSVLDDCMAVGLPSRALCWHYRSRSESLIAFANAAFYLGQLATFPSADARAPRVRAVAVDGVFEAGGSRVNRAEARAVTDELLRRAHDPALAGRSVGVVTFSLAQQNLIDDLVSAAAMSDATLAAWIEREREPLFIKNLENVQGDERDVILLCVGYGPDASGEVHMRFGPLNREDGWRRMNVAITRAREEMVVFSSMKPGDIRVAPGTPRGVAALRDFLDYAASGGGTSEPPADLADDGIAEALCDGLERLGWQAERGVGRSRFRVSVAVRDAGNPERYCLGVLLDDCPPDTSARDREITRYNVLEGLGWSLARLHALDWRRSPRMELERLARRLASGD